MIHCGIQINAKMKEISGRRADRKLPKSNLFLMLPLQFQGLPIFPRRKKRFCHGFQLKPLLLLFTCRAKRAAFFGAERVKIMECVNMDQIPLFSLQYRGNCLHINLESKAIFRNKAKPISIVIFDTEGQMGVFLNPSYDQLTVFLNNRERTQQ